MRLETMGLLQSLLNTVSVHATAVKRSVWTSCKPEQMLQNCYRIALTTV